MKTIKSLALTTLVFMQALSLSACADRGNPSETNGSYESDGNGFAVLELFTSEGCSSCPPADALLAKIEKESQGKPVYVLAYHVDYWNRLGWKDVFSNAEYSERQKQYGTWMKSSQIYTPQLIVNGTSEFIGSDESSIRKAISQQLSATSNAMLSLQVQQVHHFAVVTYKTAVVPEGSRLLIAVVEKAAQHHIGSGENAGRSLAHVQIVQQLHVEQLDKSGSGHATVSLPAGFEHQRWEVLGLIQSNKNGAISGAARADLTIEKTADKTRI